MLFRHLVDPVERALFDRSKVENDARELRAAAAAARAEVRQEDMERDLELILKHHLVQAMADESAESNPTLAADLAWFRDWCHEDRLPCLPATPQMIGCAMIEFYAEGGRTVADVERLCRSIAAMHKARAEHDPTDDVLVRATIRYLRAHAKLLAASGAIEHMPADPDDGAAPPTLN